LIVTLRRGLVAGLLGSLALLGYAVVSLNDDTPAVERAKDMFATFDFPEAEVVRAGDGEAGIVYFDLVTSSHELQIVAPPGAELDDLPDTYLFWYTVPQEDAPNGWCSVSVRRDESRDPSAHDRMYVVGVWC
jgi:hypothetical protein